MNILSRVSLLQLFLLSSVLCLKAQDPQLGAIRWDAWTGTNNTVGLQVERSLSPNQFHYRVPFFGEVHDADSVTIDGTTQAIMDQEIRFADYAGLDYWAFLWYSQSSGLDEARQLYYSSAYKDQIDYCLIVESSRLNTELPVDSLVAEFADPSYVRVMGNRPLLYFFGSWALTLGEINELRSKSVAAGHGDPYIVLFIQSAPVTIVDDLNLDALSRYVTSWIRDGAPYSDLAAADTQQWNFFKGQNKKVVPHVSAGWDKRPRVLNPMSWETAPISPDRWVEMPTPTELTDHMSDAVDWVNTNSSYAESNTVIVYAWNEHDEGGFLCPTLDSYDSTARIDAMHQVFGDPVGSIRNVVQGWDFDSNDEGWNSNPNNLSLTWNNNGYLDGTITGGDPYVRNTQAVSFTTTDIDFLELGVQNSTASSSTQVILFTTTGNVPITVPVTPNGTLFESSIVDLSTVTGWNNSLQVTDVRLDPTAWQQGSFSYDFIRFGNNDTIPITSMVVNGPTEVALSSFGQMSVTVTPTNATFQNVLYSVDNSSIATIDASSGLLTPLNSGTVTITATALDGTGITATREVTIPNQVISYDFELNKEGWSSGPNNMTTTWNSLGYLECNISGGDPNVRNTTNVSFSTTGVNYLKMRVKNETTAPTSQVILFTTSGNVPITIPLMANNTEFEDIVVDLSTISGWTNNLSVTNVRLDPTDGQQGLFSYDYISFDNDVVTIDSIAVDGPLEVSMDSIAQMSVSIWPPTVDNPTVIYSVDNTALATIDANTGLLSPILPGTVVVTAAAQDGSAIIGSKEVSITGFSEILIGWDFDANDGGWNSSPNNLTTSWSSAGYLDMAVTGSDPNVLNSSAVSFVTSAINYLEMQLKNETSAAHGQVILFTTSGNVPITVPMTPNSQEYENVIVDLTSVSGWNDSLSVTNMRLDPNDGQIGTVSLDYLHFVESYVGSISVDSIFVTGSDTLDLGETSQMLATVLPTNATLPSVMFSVDNPSVATIDPSTGFLTPVLPGTVLVTVEAQDGSGVIGTKEVEITGVRNDVIGWNFDSDDEGWNASPYNMTTSWDSLGYLVCQVTGGDPHVLNDIPISFTSTDVNYLELRLKNESASSVTQLILFTTTGNVPINVPVSPNSSAFERIILDLSSVSGWDNSLSVTNVRLDPNLGQLGTVTYDYAFFVEGYSPFISVNSISLNGPEVLDLGETAQVSASVLPLDTSDPSVIYSVNDTSVATIDPNSGLLSPVFPGTVVVTAEAQDGSGVIGTKQVEVTGVRNDVLGWSFDSTDEGWNSNPYNMTTSWDSLGYLVSQVTGGDPNVLNSSSIVFETDSINYLELRLKNESASSLTQFILFTTTGNVPVNVPVSQDGTDFERIIFDLSAVSGWNNNLSVTDVRLDPNLGQSGTITYDHIYFVENYTATNFVSSIALSGPDTLDIGASDQISASVLPVDATNSAITYSVDDPSIASIDTNTGMLTAMAPGIVIVTATAEDGSGTVGSLTVTVPNIVVSWTFDTDDEGWNSSPGNMSTAWNSLGYLDCQITGGDPKVFNSSAVSFSTTNVNFVELELLNATASTTTQLILFTTTGNVPLNIPMSPNGTDFESIIFDLSTVSGWNNSLSVTDVRLDPNMGQTGTVAYDHIYFMTEDLNITLVDSIAMTGPNEVALGTTGQISADVFPIDADNPLVVYSVDDPAVASIDPSTGVLTPLTSGSVVVTATAQDSSATTGVITVTIPNIIEGWTFDSDDEGWNYDRNNVSIAWDNSGYLESSISTGLDPHFYNSSSVSFDPTYVNYLKMNVRNNTSSSSGQVIIYTSEKEITIPVPLTSSSSSFEEVIVDLSTVCEWNNNLTITDVRLDPTSWQSGTVSYDYIYFTNSENLVPNQSRKVTPVQEAEVTASEVLGENVLESTGLRVYPNPIQMNGLLSIELPTSWEGSTGIRLYDSSGRTILYKEMRTQVGFLDIQGLDSGIYLMRLQSAAGDGHTTRIIVR